MLSSTSSAGDKTILPIYSKHGIICLTEVQVRSKIHREEPKEKPTDMEKGIGDEDIVKQVVYTGRADYAVAIRDPET